MILPPDFISRTKALLGDEYSQFDEALKSESPVSIRINPSKRSNTPDAEQISWSETGFYLPQRIPFTFDPLFHAGAYYVQEASSMFLEQAIKSHVSSPVICLDLCAAPGGKSTHLSSILPEGSLLVSNEVIRSRSNILAENIIKWGNPNNIVTNNDPADIGKLTRMFDIIVTDVPCSGEGMFRKDPESIKEWSVANVELCAARQRRIIHDCWGALRPGGLLIYSTCTYNLKENEENINYISAELGAEALPIPIQTEWGIAGALKYNNPVYRFFPHKTKGEGFFLAVLRKNTNEEYVSGRKAKNKKEQTKTLPIPAIVKDWIKSPKDYLFEMKGDKIIAFPVNHEDTYRSISAKLNIVNAGILMGETKGKDIIPSHSLAMSTARSSEMLTEIEIDYQQAIQYLRKEVIQLPSNIPKGYILVNYKRQALGFVKNIGNRANNLYPQVWRVRSSYLPESVSNVLNL